jgi:predicted Zn-dependent protease with MMP-like domain
MHRKEFDQHIEAGFMRLPESVREKIKNVALLVEDEPSAEVRAREGLRDDETLLGYYQGVPLLQRGDEYGVGVTMPDTITLYMRPILDAAKEDGKSVENVVAETIWHEYAHYCGMEEDEVRAREHERGT